MSNNPPEEDPVERRARRVRKPRYNGKTVYTEEQYRTVKNDPAVSDIFQSLVAAKILELKPHESKPLLDRIEAARVESHNLRAAAEDYMAAHPMRLSAAKQKQLINDMIKEAAAYALQLTKSARDV